LAFPWPLKDFPGSPDPSGMDLKSLRPLALLLLLLVPLTSACTGDGDGEAASLAASADVLMTDAPSEDLLFLRAEIQSVVLERPSGSMTGNLLGGPVPLDLLSLDGVFEWLLSGPIPSGEVAAVVIGFDPAGFAAAAKDGTPVTIDAASSNLRVEFPGPLTLDPETYTRIEVDFDLMASLAGTVGSGPLTLTPVGSADFSGGTGGIEIDEIKGDVVSADALTGSIVLNAFADGDLDSPLGQVTVQVSPTALLIDDDGSVFASEAAFYAALLSGLMIEVHGTLDAGVLEATEVEVEDPFGGAVVAELRGKVVDHAAGASFELLIQDVKQGASTVLPILAGLGDPASIEIGIDTGTVFFLEDSLAADESALAVGQTVEVKFLDFAAEPFPAFKIDIEDADAEFEGFVADAAGLPATFAVNLEDGDPALLAGLVASDSTDVTVTVGPADLALKVDGDPVIDPSELSADLRVKIHGALSGTPSSPTIAATRIDVLPGRLVGALVASMDSPSSTFMTTGGTIDDPFGGGITAGPLDVVLDPGCVFEGAAGSESAFFALAGTVIVRVEGLATGNPNEIRAFTVTSEAQ
jgi:hypothetical protein